MSRPLPRFRTDEHSHDPLDNWIAQRRREKERAKQRIDSGATVGDPADLRGIPVIARGVGGTSPETDPLAEAIRNDHRLRRTAAA